MSDVSDLDERAWWVFALPAALVYVPAASEESARRKVVATCYDGAPVERWPLVRTRVCSRERLVASLLASEKTSSGVERSA